MFLTKHCYQNSNFSIFLVMSLMCMLIPSLAEAQTCRVRAGVSPDGYQTFMEVFEYDFVDEKPSFPGGTEALLGFVNNTRRYPADAYRLGIEGRVVCSFVVNVDGEISNICVIKGNHKSLNMEAVRIISEMPNWIPGKIHGKNVPVRVVHSIPFRK